MVSTAVQCGVKSKGASDTINTIFREQHYMYIYVAKYRSIVFIASYIYLRENIHFSNILLTSLHAQPIIGRGVLAVGRTAYDFFFVQAMRCLAIGINEYMCKSDWLYITIMQLLLFIRPHLKCCMVAACTIMLT